MRVLVCGAGVAGLAVAWWLERDGHDVVLVERAPGRHGAGYMIDCFGAGYDALERMELLPLVRKSAFTLTELVCHNDDGSVRNRLTDADVGAGMDRMISVMRGDLEEVLHHNRTVRFNTTIESFVDDDEGVTATLTDGTVERFDLLIGADGIHSWTRGRVFGDQKVRRDLGFHTAAYVFTDPELAESLGNALCMIDAPGLQAGAYPVAGNKVATLFTHRTQAPLPDDPRAELRRVYGGLGWIVPRLLDACPDDLYYDRVAQIELPEWHRGRVVLLGDACQAMSLLTGQGAGMAIAAATTLADELRRDDDVDAALRRYADTLRPEVARLQAEGRAMADEFVPAIG